jgi:putative DNA methylase
VALTTFSDLVGEAMDRVRRDAVAAGLGDDGLPLAAGGTGAMRASPLFEGERGYFSRIA